MTDAGKPNHEPRAVLPMVFAPKSWHTALRYVTLPERLVQSSSQPWPDDRMHKARVLRSTKTGFPVRSL